MKKQHWISQFFSSKKQIQPSDNRPMTSEEKAIFLYENYYDLLINIAYKKIHNWEIAQDIVQDTFVVVLKKIDEISFEKCHKMPPLLGYILNGKIIDHLRKERKFLYTEYTGDLIDQNQSEQAQDFFCDENVQSYLSVLTAQEAQLNTTTNHRRIFVCRNRKPSAHKRTCCAQTCRTCKEKTQTTLRTKFTEKGGINHAKKQQNKRRRNQNPSLQRM